MLVLDPEGWAVSDKVQVMRRPNLKHGAMTTVAGIVVHQTGATTAQSTLSSYLNTGANGAHFLIDKDGTVYQTGSVLWKQWHVGKLRSRCLAEHTCTPVEAKSLIKLGATATNTAEMKKAVPARYPSNSDSIGIELVGGTVGTGVDPAYEVVPAAQNAALAWLVAELRQNFNVPLTEIFRHPQVSYKDPHEAESAQW